MQQEDQGAGPRRFTVAHRCPACGERFPASYRVCPKDGSTLDRAVHQRQAEDPLIGAILANTYRVVRPLTMGGMGRIYRAEHTRLKTPVVAKVVHPSLADQPGAKETARQRLEREADALLEVRSPHVLRLLDRCLTEDGRRALILEWLEGEDLAVALRREGGPFSQARALTIGCQLAAALAAAHQAGVLHRDVKPSNVFLERTHEHGDWVKLLDFGVAKLSSQEDITRDGALLGTPAYMAPEQASGAVSADERSDVYGLSAVLFHMLSGRSAVPEGDAHSQLLWLQRGNPFPSLHKTHPALHPELAKLVDQGLRRDPAERPQSARVVEEALREIQAELTPLRRPRQPPRSGVSRRSASSPRPGGPQAARGFKKVFFFYAVATPPFVALWAAELAHGVSWTPASARAAAATTGMATAVLLGRLFSQRGARGRERLTERLAGALRSASLVFFVGALFFLSFSNLTGGPPFHSTERLWLGLLVALAYLGGLALSAPVSPRKQATRTVSSRRRTRPTTASQAISAR